VLFLKANLVLLGIVDFIQNCVNVHILAKSVKFNLTQDLLINGAFFLQNKLTTEKKEAERQRKKAKKEKPGASPRGKEGKAKTPRSKIAATAKGKKVRKRGGRIDTSDEWTGFSKRRLAELADLEAKARTSTKCYQMFMKNYVKDPQIGTGFY
jgi:hypothetical protein